LVFADEQDPFVLCADAAPIEHIASESYPYLTASEAMMNVVGDLLLPGYKLGGVLVDPSSPPCPPCVSCRISQQASSVASAAAPGLSARATSCKPKS
jgi:hypothetical protein